MMSLLQRAMLTTVLCLSVSAGIAEEATVPEAPRPVITEFLSADPAAERQFSGVIRGQDVTALAFQTSGRLATLDVDAGDRVTEGQVIATLDQITLAQDVAVAQAALSAAEAQAEFAQSQYERIEALLVRNVASTAQIEAARAARDAATAKADSARADLAQTEEAARYGHLSAPRDGIILSTEVEPGTLVSSGVSVVEMADPLGREAIIDVPESFAMVIPDHAGFIVRHRSAGVDPVAATLSVIEPVAETSLETRRLRLTLDNPPEDYRIGTLITATYDSNAAPVMTLPQTAIAGTDEAPGVWRVEEAGDDAGRTVHFVPVTVGRSIGTRVVIASGLTEGDEIVVRGVHALAEGQKVGERLQ
ncbi:efflux transporter periplasmic adaptor subunit [Celeribacter ethanolicus]|uniref:Efflux transporter periplasmic adaptor subunit n=1 Tax=Celeribacter ethanolicus TaxID=1758178 RepID=A0A291GD57_9RHOB|nr:efflux RND transporter periplasmic adaptor subunit [Celeribacter ethanolicus]ATG48107.1 efflux transporter periplasmic adaptor subunit [Celeribacter ethanolicus]